MADFDWIKARAACSLQVLFKQLQVAVEGDVAAANELPNNVRSDAKFEVSPREGRFVVTRQHDDDGVRAVKFILEKAQIVVDKGAGVSFTAKPSLNTEGVCKLRVHSTDLELWQVCRMALEDLIFGK
jgi:hypothetical protein